MRRSIAAPLCSALVVPGLGQILNQQFRKGLILMGLVFVLFVAAAVKLASIINASIPVVDPAGTSQTAAFSGGDLFLVTGFTAAFLILWVYSLVDAFWVAFQSERSSREKRP